MSVWLVLLLLWLQTRSHHSSQSYQWKEGIESNEIVYSASNPRDGYYPNIGNGFIAKNVGCYKNTSTQQMNDYNNQIGATPCGSLYMNGVFNGNVSSYVHRARIPGIFAYYINTHPSDNRYNITWIGAALDMKNGIVYNQSIVYHPTICPIPTVIQIAQYTHRKYTYLLVHNISVISTSTTATNAWSCAVPLAHCNANETIDFKWNERQTFDKQLNETIVIRNMQTLTPTFINATLPFVSVVYEPIPMLISFNSITSYHSFYGIFHTSLPFDTNVSNQTALSLLCRQDLVHVLSNDRLLYEHQLEMNKLWNMRIDMTGNTTIANTVHSSLYYLFVSLNDRYPFGISADGLSSNGYRGTSFWDQNTWVSPVFMMLYPNISLYSTALYRLNGIYGAMDWFNYCAYQQKIYNYTFDNETCVQYPWTTAYTGQNTCPKIDFAYHEQHISSDIGLELKNLFYLTWDKSWFFALRSREPQTTNPRHTRYSHWNQTNFICNYWTNRFELNPVTGQYTINQIVEPDEFAGIVNSGIYTNAAAAEMLKFCTYLVDNYSPQIGNTVHYNKLKAKWTSIVNNTRISITNKLTKNSSFYVHELYEGYNGETINQADVVMLIYPLGYYEASQYEYFVLNDTLKEILHNDLIYYQTKVGGKYPFYTGDASYSISWLRLNNTLYNKQAQPFFDYGLQHVDGSHFYIWIEEYNAANGGHLNFMTGAGTFMQNIIFGYAGIKVTKQYLYINPVLPYSGNITRIKFNQLVYKSIAFVFEYDAHTMSFQGCDSASYYTNITLYVQTLIIDANAQSIKVNSSYILSASRGMSLPVQQVRLTATHSTTYRKYVGNQNENANAGRRKCQ
eukprot:71818_1